jgi:lipopolysaccharide export system protein LptA
LRFDYRRNILRYAGGVRVSQGSSTINSLNLDIFQKDFRLIAYGKVSAGLKFDQEEQPDVTEAEQEQAENESTDTGQTASGKKRRKKGKSGKDEEGDSSIISLGGERLEINKQNREIRVVKNAQALQSGMTISADEIEYELSEDDSLLKSVARRNTRVDIEGITIFGDNAQFFIQEKLLLVEGKNVKYLDAGKMESNYSKLVYDMETGTMRFDARADQLVRTRIMN